MTRGWSPWWLAAEFLWERLHHFCCGFRAPHTCSQLFSGQDSVDVSSVLPTLAQILAAAATQLGSILVHQCGWLSREPVCFCLLRGTLRQHIGVQLPDTGECGELSLRLTVLRSEGVHVTFLLFLRISALCTRSLLTRSSAPDSSGSSTEVSRAADAPEA